MKSMIRLAAVCAAALVSVSLQAAPISIPAAPAVGSTSPVQADLLVVRPTSTPCSVPLFTQQGFNDFTDKTFQYTPPTGCPGPYSRIVFSSDFSVTAGRQFDRTLYVAIGGLNVFFGTTQEPSALVSPAWHMERDITDYATALSAPQAGTASLGSVVDSTYTGMISGSATLLFYPADAANVAAKVPDLVLPLSTSPASLNSNGKPADAQLTQTFTLPTNGERVYLDVIAQSQASDEFWWTCVPSDIAAQLQSCPGTAFRETQISIDGIAAGVAPVYPWIFTGGIDPRLWRPVVGVQTLNFVPYRVDLTPFAGLLANGTSHTITVSVFNAQDHFTTTATLLIYRDPAAASITGSVTSNSLTAAPVPKITYTQADDGSISGPVSVTSTRDFSIIGSVLTSHGTVTTTVKQTIDYSNVQNFNITSDGSLYVQNIEQNTNIASTTTTISSAGTATLTSRSQWPLAFGITFITNSDGSSAQTSQSDQSYVLNVSSTPATGATYSSTLVDRVNGTDTLPISASGAATGTNTGIGRQQYRFTDSDGSCYDRTVNASAGAVTAVTDICAKSVASSTPTSPLSGGSDASGGAFAPEGLVLLALSAVFQLNRKRRVRSGR